MLFHKIVGLNGPSCLKKVTWRVQWVLVLGVALGMCSFLGLSPKVYNGFQLEPHAVPLEKILKGGPPRDGIPALLKPRFIEARKVKFLADHDRVLGLSRNGREKAYPIKILNWHEVVNDVLADFPIVVTYCPLCGSGIAFLRKVEEETFTFGVSGLLYESDLLMYDHQTESLWSQIGMEAITGQAIGKKLSPLFTEHTTWKDWQESYPDSLVLSTQTGFSRDYERDPYERYSDSGHLLFPVTNTHSQFSPKEWVLGVEVAGKYKAYPFTELQKGPAIIHDHVNGEKVEVRWDGKFHKASVWSFQTGLPLPALQTYWFAWFAFHSETDVFIAE